MNVLYIGRFQPFHLGHFDAIEQIFEQNSHIKKLYIGIGSAENNFTAENPFTAGERFEIIEKALEEKNIPADKYSIVPIRNIDHYALWPFHVQQYLPPIDSFYSGSPLVLQLWKKAFPNAVITQIEKRKNVSGTQTRKQILKNYNSKNTSQDSLKDLSAFCLSSTQKKIKEWNIPSRLNDMKTA